MKSKLLCFSTLLLLTACNNSYDSPPAADTPGGTFDISAETAPAVAAAPDPDRDMPLEDKTFYGLKGGDSVELGQVSEAASVMHHSMKIGGEDVKFTARAGHLIAYKPAAADGASDPQAAIFYTSYTRDDLPRENRPVTFFWNGGPGASSKFLHLGSWAPKRMVINPPVIPPEYFEKDQPAFPVIDDAETLLDQSDLVFVDPVGTGFSSAIAPHKNEDFWGIDSDPKILRDFITRYINTYHRQSSPKYLYGESYGGIRTPITARLLLEAGSAHYLPDSSGKPPVALSGIVLQSPVLDYNSSCALGSSVSCEGLLPTYAATADYYGLTSARRYRSMEDFMADVRTFGASAYRSVQRNIISKVTNPSETTPQQIYLGKLLKNDLRADFMAFSDARKEEFLKALDAFAPTPLRAFFFAAAASMESRFTMTAFCAEWSEAQRAAAVSLSEAPVEPELPVAVDVDIAAYKRTPLSAKEATSAQQTLNNRNFTITDLTKNMVTGGYLFDLYDLYASEIVKVWRTLSPVNCPKLKAWSDYISSVPGRTYLRDLHQHTGLHKPANDLESAWVRYPNMNFNIFLDKLLPGYSFNVYDARMSVPGMNYDPSFADTAGGNAAITDLLPGFVGYINRTAPYMGLNHHIIVSWDWTPDPQVKFSTSRLRTSIPDLIESLTLKSDLKVLVLHGYTDLVTPFHQTELDLENAKLADRIPVKNFEGGHMTYSNEASRAPMKAVLDQFYAGTLGGPGTGSASQPQVAPPMPVAAPQGPAPSPAEVAALDKDMDGIFKKANSPQFYIDADNSDDVLKLSEAMEAILAIPTASEYLKNPANFKQTRSMVDKSMELLRKMEIKGTASVSPVTVPPQAQSNFREQYIQQNSILLAKMDEIKDLIKDAVASGALPSLAVASFDAMLEGQMKQWGKLDKNQDNTKDFTSTMSALDKIKTKVVNESTPKARTQSAGVAPTEQEKAALMAEMKTLVDEARNLNSSGRADPPNLDKLGYTQARLSLDLCLERCISKKTLDQHADFDKYKAYVATAKQYIEAWKAQPVTISVTISQEDQNKLVAAIEEALLKVGPADSAMQVEIRILTNNRYLKYDLLKSPDHFNRAKNAVESINRYVEDRDKKAPGTPPPVQNQTPPPAVFVKPEPQKIPGTQDNGKSAGSVAPVPSNVPPVGALQVPLPVVDPGKSGPKEQPVTQDNNKSTESSASEHSKQEEDNIKKRDSLVARAGKVVDIYDGLLKKPDLSDLGKLSYVLAAAPTSKIQNDLKAIDMKKDNTALFKSYEDSLVKQEADAQKALADQKAPPPAPKPPVVPVSNPGTLH